MRRLVIIITVYFVSALFYLAKGQDTTLENGHSLQNILANVEEADCAKMNVIFDLDVFTYFDLNDDYSTDLKKKIFKKTQDYKDKLNELKNIKLGLLVTDYYVVLDRPYESITYDVKRKGFEVELDNNIGETPTPPKSIKGFMLSPLPTKRRSLGIFENSVGGSSDFLFLSMSEENGLEIENANGKIKVYFIFRISNKQTVSFKYYQVSVSEYYTGWVNATQQVLATNKVRVIVANEETGKIYYDKSYRN